MGGLVTCYIASYAQTRQGFCTVALADAAYCVSMDGVVVTECPVDSDLNGCCKFVATATTGDAEQCFYRYPNANAPISSCSAVQGEWVDSP